MIITKGTTAQNITASVNGQVRFNTDTDLFESFCIITLFLILIQKLIYHH